MSKEEFLKIEFNFRYDFFELWSDVHYLKYNRSMMDVFYIEFRKKDELTTNVPLVDDVAVLKVITEAPRSKFFFDSN